MITTNCKHHTRGKQMINKFDLICGLFSLVGWVILDFIGFKQLWLLIITGLCIGFSSGAIITEYMTQHRTRTKKV
jgi:hypothetical protein